MMGGITGNLVLFGMDVFNVSLTQLVLFLCVVVLLFLFVLEVEFRQVRRTARDMDDEELTLTRDIRELRDSVRDIANILKENFDFEMKEDGSDGSKPKKEDIQKPG